MGIKIRGNMKSFNKKIIVKTKNAPVYTKCYGVNVGKKSNYKVFMQNSLTNVTIEYLQEQFRIKKSNFLNERCFYRFFSPDLYENIDALSSFGVNLGTHVIIDERSIINVAIYAPEFEGCSFNFIVNWNHFVNNLLRKEHPISTENFSEFKRKFDSFLPANIYLKEYNNIQYIYTIENDILYRTAKFDLSFWIDSSHICNRKERICVTYNLDNSHRNFQKTFKLNLPSKEYAVLWKDNVEYFTGEIVEYNEKYYKAIKDNNSSIPNLSKNDWQVISFNDFSFSNVSSFYNTEYGKQTYKFLKENLKFFIEKNIGEKIILQLFGSFACDLNDFFKYNSKSYRIVEIEIVYENNNNSIKITGIEILDHINENTLKIFDDVKFNFDDSSVDSCRLYSNKISICVPKTIMAYSDIVPINFERKTKDEC